MSTRRAFIFSSVTFLFFASLAFSEHGQTPIIRPKIPARTNECSQFKFESTYGLDRIEDAAKGKAPERLHPLLPIEEITQKKYGGGGPGATWAYEVTAGWKYRAPKDSVFRLAVSDSLSCLLDNLGSSANFLSELLNQDDLFRQYQPHPGPLKKDSSSTAEDLLVFQKMRELFTSLKIVLEEHKGQKDFEDFFRAFFKQIKLTEESLLSKSPKLEAHPEFLKQIDKLREEASPQLKEFLKTFSKSPEFDYWLHPLLANYFRQALSDPSFSLASEKALTDAQTQDLGRQFQQILQGTKLLADVKGPSLIDPIHNQGKVKITQGTSGPAADVFVPQATELLNSEFEMFQRRLERLERRQSQSLEHGTAQKLSRALNDLAPQPGQSLSPSHLALRDAVRGVLPGLSQKPEFAQLASSHEGPSAESRNKTDREVLDPLRTKLEAELPGYKYPISLDSIETVADYPDSVKELIQTITRRVEPKSLSIKARQALEDFLMTGETQHLFDLLFKNRSAFDGAVLFIRGAKEASPNDQSLSRAASLLTQMNSPAFKPSKSWMDEYAYTRRLLKDSIDQLSQDHSREKDRDAHLFALRILDELGLVGVTDRDQKERNSYLPGTLYQELGNEQRHLNEACEEAPNRADCIQKIERSFLERAEKFVGSHTGLTSEIRSRMLDSFSANNPARKSLEAHLRRLEHLPPGSPLRQGVLFSKDFRVDSLNDNQTNPISKQEADQRIFNRDETDESPASLAPRMPEMFRNKLEAGRLGSELAMQLSALFSIAGMEEGPLRDFYKCLSASLSEHTGDRNNVLAIRTLTQWLINKEGTGQRERLKQATKEFRCEVPEALTESSVPTGLGSEATRSRIQVLAQKLSDLHQKDLKLSPSALSEQALIELETLRRLEIDIRREENLFGKRNNPTMKFLQEKREASIQRLKKLGFSDLLDNPQIKAGLEPDKDRPFLNKTELASLEREYKLFYDPTTNSFLVTPETKFDQKLFELLSRAHGINLRYQSPGRENERFILNGGNSRALLALLANEASAHGIAPLSTRMNWEEIHRLDSSNPDGKPLPQWFPMTEATSARLVERGGELSVEFISNDDLSAETRKKMEALIQARSDAHLAAANYGGLGHSFKSYFGHMVGYDPNKTKETQELQEAYNRYAGLRSAFGNLGLAPIGGTPMTTKQFNSTELQMMRDYLNREDEAIHSFLTNVETLHTLMELVVTAPIGAVGKIATVEASLAKLAAGTGKSAIAARNALRALRLAGQIAKPIGAATRHGLAFSGGIQGIEGATEYVMSHFPNSANAIAEDRIKRAKEGGFGSQWRSYPEHPGRDPKWGTFDQNGLPTDPALREEFRKAMLEFNMEESMDIDGDGVIDELQGQDGTPVPFARKRDFLSSLTDPHRLQHFVDSAAFFRNLNLAKSLPVPRWISIPTEMSLAGTYQELMRSEDTVRWDAKKSGEPPKALLERLLQSSRDNFIEGGRFGLSGLASNAALTRMVGGKNSAFNVFLGALLFTGVDSATKAALNQAQYGYTGFERGSWEEFAKDFVKDNSVTFYIGMGIARSGLSRKQFQDLKGTYLKGGESALRTATGGNEELVETIRLAVGDNDLANASAAVQRDHLSFMEARAKEGNHRFLEAVNLASQSGAPILGQQEALRLTEINQNLLRLFRQGAWNNRDAISGLILEQDQIIDKLHKTMPDPRQLSLLEARMAEGAASSDPKVQESFTRDVLKLEAQQRMLMELTEATSQMSSLRLFAEPVKTMTALADPQSELARQTFQQQPHALAAIQRYQKTFGQQAWRRLSQFADALVEENVVPDLRRSDTGEGGPRELIFGGRPSNAGFTGREQRAAAELIERVFKATSSSSMDAKRELLGILYELDPVRADALAKTLPELGKSQ